MEDREDRRVAMTKKLLKEALISLMKDKPLHSISIKRICEVAGINRGTFYHHYETQFALYEDVMTDVSDEIGGLIRDAKQRDGSMLPILTEVFRYAEDNRELFLVILSTNSGLNLGEVFTKHVNRYLEKENNSEMFNYCTQFIAAGIANILWIWLNEENRRSARDIAMVIQALLWHGIKKASLLAGGASTPQPRQENETS